MISAEPHVAINWATGIDYATGRPIEVPAARYTDAPFVVAPSGFGAHNWHPMAYSPLSKLVFIPSQDLLAPYADEPDFEFTEGFWNGGAEFEGLQTPDDPAVAAEVARQMRGQLVAWDPVAQREVWRYQHAGPWNGGVLATAGNLVFQGSLIGDFAAYDADSGKRLWQFPSQTGIVAAPIAYSVDREQHVAVAAGWGTIFALFGGDGSAALRHSKQSRILAFKLGARHSLPRRDVVALANLPEPPASQASDAEIAAGKDIYYERCFMCHGENVASGGVLPDLRRLTKEKHDIWDSIVLDGMLRDIGMPAFEQILSKQDSAAVHAFVIERARHAYDNQQ